MAQLSAKSSKLLTNLIHKLGEKAKDYRSEPLWMQFENAMAEDETFSEFPTHTLSGFFLSTIERHANALDWTGTAQQRASLIDDLHELFANYPFEYTLTYQLQGLKPYSGYSIDLSPEMKIYTAVSVPFDDVGKLEYSGVFLSIKVYGFMRSFSLNSLIEKANLALRQILFFLGRDHRFDKFSLSITDHRLVWRDATGKSVVANGTLDSSLLFRLKMQAIDESTLMVGAGLLGHVATTDEDRSAAIQGGWDKAKVFFGLDEGPLKNQLSAAIEWYVDSTTEVNQTVAYLKVCIGIEALLGDSDKPMNELSARLGDRYAFMVGRNRDERASLAKTFNNVLNLRGELVHARQRTIGRGRAHLLGEARKILNHCIEHELTTLKFAADEN